MDQNTIALLVIALLNSITAYYTWRTRQDVAVVKHETNGMKDALVASTDKAAHAAGKEEGRLAGEAKAATLAEGVLLEKGRP